MSAHGERIKPLADRIGVAWRTVRDAQAGKLRSASKAMKIAEAIGRDERGAFIVDPSSMLALGQAEDDAA